MLRVIQLLCEGHYRPLQDLLRLQPGNVKSFNIVRSLANYFKTLGKINKIAVDSSVYFNIEIQIMDTMIELCQGCPENSLELFNHKIIKTLNILTSHKLAPRALKTIVGCQEQTSSTGHQNESSSSGFFRLLVGNTRSGSSIKHAKRNNTQLSTILRSAENMRRKSVVAWESVQTSSQIWDIKSKAISLLRNCFEGEMKGLSEVSRQINWDSIFTALEEAYFFTNQPSKSIKEMGIAGYDAFIVYSIFKPFINPFDLKPKYYDASHAKASDMDLNQLLLDQSSSAIFSVQQCLMDSVFKKTEAFRFFERHSGRIEYLKENGQLAIVKEG